MPGMDPTSNRLSSQKKKARLILLQKISNVNIRGLEKMAPFSDVSDGFVHAGNEQ